MALGSVYSWSVYRLPLQELMGLSATQSLLPYTAALVSYAFLMPAGGLLIQRFGPGLALGLGALMVGTGNWLGAFAESLGGLVFGCGILAGAGVGLAYGAPLAVSARWMPQAQGLALGCTVVGFGLSPLVTAPLAAWLVGSFGVRWALGAMGVGIALVVLTGALVLRFPPATPLPGASGDSSPKSGKGMSRRFVEVLGQPAFGVLWGCFAVGTFIGLSAIGITVTVAQEFHSLSASHAAAWLSLFAVCNGLSRPLMGALADRISIRVLVMFLLVLALAANGSLSFWGQSSFAIYVCGFGVLWFTLGGWLALAPAATAALFGAADLARNYGFMFTAYGVGALAGTLATGALRDAFGGYGAVFPALAAAAGLGLGLAILPGKDSGSRG